MKSFGISTLAVAVVVIVLPTSAKAAATTGSAGENWVALPPGTKKAAETTTTTVVKAGTITENNWVLVAHVRKNGGMFMYNADLDPTKSYGKFYENPKPHTPDFQRQFPFAPTKIKFVTGNLAHSAVFDWDRLRSVIDAKNGGETGTNIDYQYSDDGEKTYINKRGNVMSRNVTDFHEDPWIDLAETHCDGGCQTIIWGEAGYGPDEDWIPLTTKNDGMNVYISTNNMKPGSLLIADGVYPPHFNISLTHSRTIYHVGSI